MVKNNAALKRINMRVRTSGIPIMSSTETEAFVDKGEVVILRTSMKGNVIPYYSSF